MGTFFGSLTVACIVLAAIFLARGSKDWFWWLVAAVLLAPVR